MLIFMKEGERKMSTQTQTQMKTIDIQHQLGADTLSVRDSVYTAKWCFFYKNNRSAETCKEHVESVFPNAYVKDSGGHWHSFVGGAKTGGPQDSYFWVTFKLN